MTPSQGRVLARIPGERRGSPALRLLHAVVPGLTCATIALALLASSVRAEDTPSAPTGDYASDSMGTVAQVQPTDAAPDTVAPATDVPPPPVEPAPEPPPNVTSEEPRP